MNRSARRLFRSLRTSVRSRSANQDGFTVLELAIVAALMMLVIAGAAVSLTTSVHEDAFETARTETQTNMRAVLNKMTKEIRQASAVDSASTPTDLRITTPINGSAVLVRYWVDGNRLRRTVGTANPTVVTRVAPETTFAYTPDAPTAQRVAIHLAVHPPQAPDTTLVLDADIALRNRQ